MVYSVSFKIIGKEEIYLLIAARKQSYNSKVHTGSANSRKYSFNTLATEFMANVARSGGLDPSRLRLREDK